MKNRVLVISAFLLALAASGPIPAAGAATPPTVSSVSPLKAKVGETLTVRGSGFVAGPRRNTVIFMSDYGPTVFVKASQATSTRLTVPLPSALEKGMRGYPSSPRANRFRLRVVSREKARSFTPASKSPVISPRATTPPPPPDFDKDGTPDSEDPDDDNDFLDDSLEKTVKTDPRNIDTDGDRLEDGWEYYSARDLNIKAVPYPGERPFPNALDPSDGNVDFDGDFLRSHEEHTLWQKVSKRSFQSSRLSNGVEDSPLGYSDGTQTSRPDEAPKEPDFQRFPTLYAAEWAEPSYPSFLDRDNDSKWSDDERDADEDGLSNVTEEHLEMSKRAWNAWLKDCDPEVKPWADPKEGQYYGAFQERPFAEPTMLDPDADGDGLLDGEDDQDNDGVPNYSELDFSCDDGLWGEDPDGDGPEVAQPEPDGKPNVHPYNPCAPHGGYWTGINGIPMSRTCPRYKPLAG